MLKPVHIIVACAENRVIGRDGRLPWRIPEDARFFHEQTAGRICILGRICFDTWPRARADGRKPIVVTSRPLPDRPPRGTTETTPTAVRSFPEALAAADAMPGEIMVCGGTRIFNEALALHGHRPLHLFLTLVHATVEGDTYMPEWRHLAWRETQRRESGDENFRYTFSTLVAVPGPA